MRGSRRLLHQAGPRRLLALEGALDVADLGGGDCELPAYLAIRAALRSQFTRRAEVQVCLLGLAQHGPPLTPDSQLAASTLSGRSTLPPPSRGSKRQCKTLKPLGHLRACWLSNSLVLCGSRGAKLGIGAVLARACSCMRHCVGASVFAVAVITGQDLTEPRLSGSTLKKTLQALVRQVEAPSSRLRANSKVASILHAAQMFRAPKAAVELQVASDCCMTCQRLHLSGSGARAGRRERRNLVASCLTDAAARTHLQTFKRACHISNCDRSFVSVRKTDFLGRMH
jgi:hypothetical protein